MLYLASRQLSFSGMWQAMLTADWSVLLPYFACLAAQHFFRAWRWGQLLAPIAPVPFRRILPISSVGFFAILALPLRMGELVRPYLIADPPSIRMSHGLGTMAVERVLDGLILSLSAFVVVAVARHRMVSARCPEVIEELERLLDRAPAGRESDRPAVNRSGRDGAEREGA